MDAELQERSFGLSTILSFDLHYSESSMHESERGFVPYDIERVLNNFFDDKSSDADWKPFNEVQRYWAARYIARLESELEKSIAIRLGGSPYDEMVHLEVTSIKNGSLIIFNIEVSFGDNWLAKYLGTALIASLLLGSAPDAVDGYKYLQKEIQTAIEQTLSDSSKTPVTKPGRSNEPLVPNEYGVEFHYRDPEEFTSYLKKIAK